MTNTELDEGRRAEMREYAAKWRAANRDKARAYNKTYWTKRAAARLEAVEA